MKIQPLSVKKKFNSSPEKVFAAWSDSEHLKMWLKPNDEWHTESSNTFEVGGHYKHVMVSKEGERWGHFGEYKEIVPLKKIVFTWNSPAVKDTLVTVELEAIEGGTELTLTHDLFLNEEEKERHMVGWKGCLGSLENYLKH